MRWCFAVALCLAASPSLLNAQVNDTSIGTPVAIPTPAPAAHVSKKDIKAAAKAFHKGVNAVKHSDLEAALKDFETATALDPGQRDYADSAELTRQQLAKKLMAQADQQLVAGDKAAAETLARVQRLDPHNPDLKERLQQLALSQAPRHIHHDEAYAEDEIKLEAKRGAVPFQVRGDTRAAYEQMARTFGLVAVYDNSLPSKQIRIDVDKITFEELSDLLQRMTGTFIVPVTEKQFLVAADNAENRRQYERLWVQTFYLSEPSTPAELNDISNLLRNIFEVRSIAADPSAGTITAKAPRRILDAFSKVVDALNAGEPEVSLRVQIIDVDNTYTRQLGTTLPTQFTAFNVQTEERSLLGTANLSSISSLLSSGNLGSASAAAIAALLSQAQGSSSSSASSLLSQPIAVFGGGITQTGVAVPPATFTANYSQSWLRSLQSATILGIQGKESTLRAGTRYPIVSALFSSVSAANIGSNGTQSATVPLAPSFTYEDLGITLKTTPEIHSDTDITLKVSLQVRSLGSQSLNDVPIINNRQYESSVGLKTGETAVIAGAMTKSDIRSVAGLPLISLLPGVGLLASQPNKQTEQDTLLILITPTLVRGSFPHSAEIWLPPTKQ